jgi:hypothetical protein
MSHSPPFPPKGAKEIIYLPYYAPFGGKGGECDIAKEMELQKLYSCR